MNTPGTTSRGLVPMPSKRTITLTCRHCGKTFTRLAYRVAMPDHAGYCSLSCGAKARIGPRAVNWKGGRTKKDGYILIRRSDHPHADPSTGYVREHRLIVEQSIGRYLTPEEVVHHINGDKSDNRIGNLAVMSASEHSRLHGGRASVLHRSSGEFTCQECGRSDVRHECLGLCKACYIRQWKRNRPTRLCDACGEIRQIYAAALCRRCYESERKARASAAYRLYPVDGLFE